MSLVCDTLPWATLTVSAQGWALLTSFYHQDWYWGIIWGLMFWLPSWLAFYVDAPTSVAWVQLPLALILFSLAGWCMARFVKNIVAYYQPQAQQQPIEIKRKHHDVVWLQFWAIYVSILMLVGRFSRPCLLLGVPRSSELILGISLAIAAALIMLHSLMTHWGRTVWLYIIPGAVRVAWTVLYGQLDLANWRPWADILYISSLCFIVYPLMWLMWRKQPRFVHLFPVAFVTVFIVDLFFAIIIAVLTIIGWSTGWTSLMIVNSHFIGILNFFILIVIVAELGSLYTKVFRKNTK